MEFRLVMPQLLFLNPLTLVFRGNGSLSLPIFTVRLEGPRVYSLYPELVRPPVFEKQY